jgi:hypothetical protein
MVTEAQAREFACGWIQAWNSHNLDSIMSYYAPGVVLVSPLVAKILGCSSGAVEGRPALCSYFTRGLELHPNLSFQLLDVMCGVSSILVYYLNEAGVRNGEFMEFGPDGKVVRVVAVKACQPSAGTTAAPEPRGER